MNELKQLLFVGGFVGLIAVQVGMHALTAIVQTAKKGATS